MDTPVALLIFNRPAATSQVFERIAAARPKTLLVVADGPRADHPEDVAACAAARAIVERVDWTCELVRKYSDVNLGVGVAPARGLQWVFEQFEEAIVLEDDCVPHPTFFRYCGELLAAYRHDERVMHISGDNWNFAAAGSPASYFFSAYCYSCGWATWRRAFRRYDPGLALWPALRETGWMLDVLGDAEAVEFWRDKFDRVHAHGVAVHGWDWPWLFACWAHRGLSILPRTNLITNVGFGADATHTRRRDDPRAFVPALPMSFPLRHPLVMARDLEADRSIADQVGVPREKQDLYHRLRRACVDALPAPLRRSLASARARLVPAHPPRA